jgi:hypothetical protein
MRNSDRAWVALAGGVAAYDLIATDDEQLTQRGPPVLQVSADCHRVDDPGDSLHLVGGIPPWCDPITLTFAAYRRLLRQFWLRPKAEQRDSLVAATVVRKFAA